MNDRILHYVALGAYVAALSWFMCHRIFELGFCMGSLDKEGKLDAIRKRTLTRGNILEYTPRGTRRKTPQTGDSNSLQRSGPDEKTASPDPKEEA